LKERLGGNLLRVLDDKVSGPPPIWLMRQAGRYLPEYRRMRTRAKSFWHLCMHPESAAEVTLQPVRRFDLDAAIIFSDILVVPYALGKHVEFEDGLGPRLEVTRACAELRGDVTEWQEKLAPVYEAIQRVSADLPKGKDLIGFAGGPWTIAAYMAQGQSSADQSAAKLWAYRDPKGFRALLWIIAECVVWHLCAQIKAGATVVQLFDSWAGGLNETLFQECVVTPSRYVVEQVRKNAPHVKIIGFPRAATAEGYLAYVDATAVDGLSLDTAVPMKWAVKTFGKRAALQGNLDPFVLMVGGAALTRAVDHLLEVTRGARYIVNLGHGVVPETPVENVAELVRRVRGAR
jgi:uroporphyrinogen decarboxylase